MENKYRTSGQYEQDALLVSDCYLQGLSYRAIAKKINEMPGRSYQISYGAVSIHVKEILEEWRTARVDNIDELQMIQLKKIDNLEATYWQGWYDAMKPKTKKSEKALAKEIPCVNTIGRGPGTKVEPFKDKLQSIERYEIVEDGRSDPRFLDGIASCIQLRCSILGIAGQKRIDDRDSITNQPIDVYLGLPPDVTEALKKAGPIWKQQHLEARKNNLEI